MRHSSFALQTMFAASGSEPPTRASRRNVHHGRLPNLRHPRTQARRTTHRFSTLISRRFYFLPLAFVRPALRYSNIAATFDGVQHCSRILCRSARHVKYVTSIEIEAPSCRMLVFSDCGCRGVYLVISAMCTTSYTTILNHVLRDVFAQFFQNMTSQTRHLGDSFCMGCLLHAWDAFHRLRLPVAGLGCFRALTL